MTDNPLKCVRCEVQIERVEEGTQCDDGTILCNDCAQHLFDYEGDGSEDDIDDDGGVF